MGILRDLLGFGSTGASGEDVGKWIERYDYEVGVGSRNAQGQQISGTSSGIAWRMEWGAPSRDYIPNIELRVRAEVGYEFKPYGLLASRRLYEALMQRAFSLFTDSLQTMPGTSLPEELRWVSTLKEYAEFPQQLRPQLAVSGTPPLVFNRFWNGMAEDWQQSKILKEWDGGKNPLIVMMTRGKLYIRMSIEGPSIDELEIMREVIGLTCKHIPLLRNAE
jgi:hypothetical protein